MKIVRMRVGPFRGQEVKMREHEADAAVAAGIAEGSLSRITRAATEPKSWGWGRNGETGQPCTRETRRCPAATDYTRPTPPCCRRHIRDILAVLLGLAKREGLTVFGDYGTLHGAVHCRGLLPHDKDGDLSALGDELDRWLALKEEIESAGFWFRWKPPKSREFGAGNSIKVCVSEKNRTNVDIFFWYRRDDGTYYRKNYVNVDRYKRREFHESQVFPLEELPYEDLTIPVPKDPATFSEWRIGHPWCEQLYANHDGVMR